MHGLEATYHAGNSMSLSGKRKATVRGASLLILATLMGCGGGSDSTSDAMYRQSESVGDAAPSMQIQAASVQATPVAATELALNGTFTTGLTAWTVGDAVLVNSELRKGAKALNVGWQAVQTLSATALAPRKSYTFSVRARNENTSGAAQISIRFKWPPGYEAFRTYKVIVNSNVYQDYKIEFVTPEFVALADIVITAKGSRTIIDSVSLKARGEIVQTEAIASSAGSYVPAGYSMVFNDEFNGTALNRNKWATRYIYGGETNDRLHDEKQRYRDNTNHIVANGVLNLTARKVSTTDPNGINYESGIIRSLWTSRYGYYEARVKMPRGVGVWPAFWLNSDVSSAGKLSWPPEIDIFEFVNNGVEDKANMLHSNVVVRPNVPSQVLYADPAFDKTWTFYRAPFDFATDWHTVGAEWDANTVTMYVDGKKIYTRTYTWAYLDGSAAGPAHILLNLAIGGHGPAATVSMTLPFPRRFKSIGCAPTKS